MKGEKTKLPIKWLLLIAMITGTVATIISLVHPERITDRQLENLSFLRQMHAAYNISSTSGWIRLFAEWNVAENLRDFSSGTIHMSYTTLAYLPQSVLAAITKTRANYLSASFGLSSFALAFCGFAIGFCTDKNRSRPNGAQLPVSPTAIITSLLFITNPNILMAIVEPDFEDSFIIALFMGSFLYEVGRKAFANLAFFAGSFLYPLGAGAFIACFGFSTASRAFLELARSHSFRKKCWFKIPLANEITIVPFLSGAATYAITRIAFQFTSTERDFSGGTLATRMGLDLSDTYYGGIIGRVRFLLPISGIPEKIKHSGIIKDLDLPGLWLTLNYSQIAIAFAMLGGIALAAGASSLLERNPKDKTPMPLLPKLFLILTVSIIIFLPEWSSVHFRLVARFFSPAMSYILADLIVNLSKRAIPQTTYRTSVASIVAATICLEQLHFFFKFGLML